MATPRTALQKTVSFNGKDYLVDREDYLENPADWDQEFAQGMAKGMGIDGGLSDNQWEVIRFIRTFWRETDSCPTVYQTCRALGLHVAGFGFLFPSGYQRGACKLAGISYKAGSSVRANGTPDPNQQTYRIDIWGFLVDPDEWDDRFALLKAHEMKLPGGLTTDHWKILWFLRQEYFRTGKIPTISETCESVEIDLEKFEALFPDGYHRGAIKLAGLCAY